ncbi:MAG: cation:proton antiporter [Elusimicrobiota bacterium]|jgi:CPA2 family monovalent cation:H+ antiporter-2|nr:cation:proton antiporter [Elusimicrobiota bacterium]
MAEYGLLEILAVGFVFALICGYITQKLGLSSIVGYLIAGFFIGPFTPGFVADTELAFQLSEVGVILLMFGVGLHFDIKDLLSVKGVAIPGAIAQSFFAAVCGTYVGMYFGLSLQSSLILGLGLAVASTVVLIRVLTDNNMVSTIHGHVAVGWLVVEDILTVLILVLLPTLASILLSTELVNTGNQTIEILKSIGIAVLRLAALWIIVMGLGGKVVPWILAKVAKTRSQELFTVTVLVLAFATAVGAALIFQASLALGAFLGGMVVGRTKLSHQAGADMLPLRDAFAVLFFLSVGMLLDPKFLIQYPYLILACLAIVFFIKPLTALIVVTLLGYSTRTALTVAAGLSQVGEFSFILAQEAKRLGLAGDTVYSAVVVCAIVSITFNPAIFKQVPKFEKFLRTKVKIWKVLNYISIKKGNTANNKLIETLSPLVKHEGESAIVVGYGPTGKNVSAALIEHNIKPTIIDMNIDTILSLNKKDINAVYGNSTKREILKAAGIENASYLIVTVPMLEVASETAALCAMLNPKTRVLVRSRFLSSEAHLKQIGVDGIAFEEEAIGNSLTKLLLDDLQKQKEEQESASSAEIQNTAIQSK